MIFRDGMYHRSRLQLPSSAPSLTLHFLKESLTARGHHHHHCHHDHDHHQDHFHHDHDDHQVDLSRPPVLVVHHQLNISVPVGATARLSCTVTATS